MCGVFFTRFFTKKNYIDRCAKIKKQRKKMSTQVQGTLLDVLKKKMRQTKEEMEKYKDECGDYHKRLQVEMLRREEVRKFPIFSVTPRILASSTYTRLREIFFRFYLFLRKTRMRYYACVCACIVQYDVFFY